jgi:hypothetical protein
LTATHIGPFCVTTRFELTWPFPVPAWLFDALLVMDLSRGAGTRTTSPSSDSDEHATRT